MPERKLQYCGISGTLFSRHRRLAGAPDFAFHFNDIPYFCTAIRQLSRHGRFDRMKNSKFIKNQPESAAIAARRRE